MHWTYNHRRNYAIVSPQYLLLESFNKAFSKCTSMWKLGEVTVKIILMCLTPGNKVVKESALWKRMFTHFGHQPVQCTPAGLVLGNQRYKDQFPIPCIRNAHQGIYTLWEFSHQSEEIREWAPRRHERAYTNIGRSQDNWHVLYWLAIEYQNDKGLKNIYSILFGMARNATRTSPKPCTHQELL